MLLLVDYQLETGGLPPAILSVLSKRELEVVRLIYNEYSSKQIADQLFISKYTVDNHRKNIFRKTGVQNVSGLVRWAQRMGIEDLL